MLSYSQTIPKKPVLRSCRLALPSEARICHAQGMDWFSGKPNGGKSMATGTKTPVVSIAEISKSDAQMLLQGKVDKLIDLGAEALGDLKAAMIEVAAEDLLVILQERAKHTFLLVWKGGKIPRGAIILGKAIAWTQNGTVQDTGGEIIGTYARLAEFGGPEKNIQVMVVWALQS